MKVRWARHSNYSFIPALRLRLDVHQTLSHYEDPVSSHLRNYFKLIATQHIGLFDMAVNHLESHELFGKIGHEVLPKMTKGRVITGNDEPRIM